MQTVNTINDLRTLVKSKKREGLKIGFVPTMGNLHHGHLTLVTEALKKSDYVVSSIFVNPTQFGAGEDFENYPKTLEADSENLENAGCHLLFAPGVDEMYPLGNQTWVTVHVTEITKHHCGAARPDHFDGVSTVVSKLFNMVAPDIAFFGKKDFQQLAVIRRMVKALCFDIEITGIPTVREPNGLAMSSRNGYLNPREKETAATLYQVLQETRNAIVGGSADFPKLTIQATATLENAGFRPDYFNISNADSLEPATANDTRLVILAAAYLGKARLIDNIEVQCS